MEVDGALIITRWVFYTAATIAFGSTLFPLYAFRRGEGPGRPPPLVAWASGLTLLTSLAWLGLMIVDFGGEDLSSFITTARTLLFDTTFGPAWLVRLTAALALFAAALARLPAIALAAPAAVVLASEAWMGHAAIGGLLRYACQAGHMLCVGAWLGGLVLLAAELRGVDTPEREGRAERTLWRFSAMGLVSVGGIAVTGVANTWFTIGRVPNIDIAYDRSLTIKVTLFLAMVAVAVTNRFRLLPRLGGEHATRRKVLGTLRRTVFLEQGLGLATLFAASIVGLSNPEN